MMPNLIISGFMATGKTVVGRIVARRLGRPFVDTDEEIERRTGLQVREIFARHGEPFFREQEAALVRDLAGRCGLVIATGGGTLVDPQNLRLLRASGLIVVLRARPETIAARISDPEERPLLAGRRGPELVARIGELLARRKAVYEAADFTVDTDDRGPGEVAALIVEFVKGGATGGTQGHG